jgi:hypothetical protein
MKGANFLADSKSKTRMGALLSVSLLVSFWAVSEIANVDRSPGSWLVRRVVWAANYVFHPGEWRFRYDVRVATHRGEITISDTVQCKSWISSDPIRYPDPAWYEGKLAISDRASRIIAAVPPVCAINAKNHERGRPLDLQLNYIPILAAVDDVDYPSELTVYISPRRLKSGIAGLKLLEIAVTEDADKGDRPWAEPFGIWGWPTRYIHEHSGGPTVVDLFPESNPWRYNGLVAFSASSSDDKAIRELADNLAKIDKPTVLQGDLAERITTKFFSKYRALFIDLNAEFSVKVGTWDDPDLYADAMPFDLSQGMFRLDTKHPGIARLYPAKQISLSALEAKSTTFKFGNEIMQADVKDGSVLFDPVTQRFLYLRLIVAHWTPFAQTGNDDGND